MIAVREATLVNGNDSGSTVFVLVILIDAPRHHDLEHLSLFTTLVFSLLSSCLIEFIHGADSR